MGNSLIDPSMARELAEQERLHPHVWRGDSGSARWVKAKFPYDHRILIPYQGRLVEECPLDIQRLFFELDFYQRIAWGIEPDAVLRIMMRSG